MPTWQRGRFKGRDRWQCQIIAVDDAFQDQIIINMYL